jgi:hypothetical protein
MNTTQTTAEKRAAAFARLEEGFESGKLTVDEMRLFEADLEELYPYEAGESSY